MKPQARTLILFAAFAAPSAFAQGTTDYALNDGQVHFRVPPGWSAIMEKRDGNPQAVAFQVPDAAAQGSEDSATVTVKTRKLNGSAAFAGVVQEELERSKAQTGYESDASNKDAAVHQYFVTRGKTRYLVRDSFYLTGNVAAEVRCQRPMLASTPAAWNTEFDHACDGVVASLKQ